MRTLILLLFCLCTANAAELYQVVPWSAASTNLQERIDGIPPEWPMQTVPVPTNSVGTNVLTARQIDNLRTRLAPDYAAYESRRAEREAALDAVARNAKQVLFDLLDDFAGYEEGWKGGTNYTAAQLQTIVRKHNRALIKMRPIIRDLYREE